MLNRFAVLLLTTFALQSCMVKISPSDESWNSYEVGDTFIFENEEGLSKSFEVTEITTQEIKENVYAGNLSRKKENLVVMAVQTSPNQSDPFPLLVLSGDREDGTSLGLTLAIPNQLEANYFVNLNTINANETLAIKEKEYVNVVAVETNLSVSQDVEIPYPTKLYFKKEIGYLGYDLSNGEEWRLL